MIPSEILDEYNRSRTCRDRSVVCHAPFTNMRFYQSGDVFACALNAVHVLGTYPQNSICEMWFGGPATELREALRANDLSRGCVWCTHELQSRNFTGAKCTFDRYADEREEERQAASWFQRAQRRFRRAPAMELPRSMEFSLSNTCNLECVMCRGFFSSAIRRNREHLPFQESPYDAAFVEQLEEFIPSLSVAQFQGGEPFLIDLYYEIWDRILPLNPEMEVHITTNATVLHERARTILEDLNCHLILSLDSLEAETLEAIRRNVSYEQVMRNVASFQDYSARHGRVLTLAVCLLPQNWREIPRIVEYCNQHDMVVWFNTVFCPIDFSLMSLSCTELGEIADYWNGFDLPTDTWLTALNRSRFASAIHQVMQWRDDACRRQETPPALAWGIEEISSPGGDPTPEMSQVFKRVMSSQTAADRPSEPAIAGIGDCELQWNTKLQDYLRSKLLESTEEPFLRGYCSALKDAFLFSSPSCPEAQKTEMLGKLDRLSQRLVQHYARDYLLMILVESDIRDVLQGLRDGPRAPGSGRDTIRDLLERLELNRTG